jgi:hypothetical protein
MVVIGFQTFTNEPSSLGLKNRSIQVLVPSQNLWVDQEFQHQITVRGQSVTLSKISAKLALEAE